MIIYTNKFKMEIQGYPDYLIYDDGRVFSKKKNRFMKQYKNYKGYLQIRLCNDGGRKNFRVHRLVGLHYIPNPENKPMIDHINRERDDNRKENLRWATDSENQQNRNVSHNNKLGIKNICYDKSHNRYLYDKIMNGVRHQKYFKTLEEAIDYKNQFEDLTSAPVVPTD